MDNSLIEKMKRIEISGLDLISDICSKIKIPYFLIGGTLLGAVRHKGFIPWDDDIDVAMYRKDYETFFKYWIDNNLNESTGWIIQNKETDKEVSVNFTKIRKIGTELIEKENRHAPFFKGVFVDIFPIDNITEKDNLFTFLRYKRFMFLNYIALYKNGYFRGRKSFGIFVLSLFSWISYKHINNVSKRIMTKYADVETGWVTSYASGYGYKKQRMKKDVYGSGIFLTFEDKNYLCPCLYDKYLKNLFGDYMKLPPKEKQVSNHRIISLKIDKQ